MICLLQRGSFRSARLGKLLVPSRAFSNTATAAVMRTSGEIQRFGDGQYTVLPAASDTSAPVLAWITGVPLESTAAAQLAGISRLPIIHRHVAVMPDVHMGKGATIGSVIPTVRAIVPAAVGVDIGCGMCAVRTSLRAEDVPVDLRPLREAIEAAVPHGRTANGGPGDAGAWRQVPSHVSGVWQAQLAAGFDRILASHPKIGAGNDINHLGTLGTGNHFVEVCLDEAGALWVMLHSGSRGVGNRIGTYFISAAKRDLAAAGLEGTVPVGHADLAYLREDTPLFADYVHAVGWAQAYAAASRKVMLAAVLAAMATAPGVRLPPFTATLEAVNCHHNYVSRERHGGAEVWVTRKGALSAAAGELGIVPGSMGARSFIVRGRGSAAAFNSCSHGAGRLMSRGATKAAFSLEDHARATAGVECRKDVGVLDETPGAYKDIDAVMAAQRDLVEVVHTLRQIVCVKG